jgi:aldose 1-epimerase
MASVSAFHRRGDGFQRITLEHARRHALRAEFLLDAGMLGVSLRSDADELLAQPRSVDDYIAGGSTGMPLLHPYANRLSRHEFDAYGVHFDARGTARDRNDLPIHGTMHGRPFELDEVHVHEGQALCATTFAFTAPELLRSFPFPHTIEIIVALRDARLTVQTVVHNHGDRPMPVSFGWHPFFTLPSRPRADWVLRLPACRRHVLDDRLIPTGATVEQAEDRSPIGDRVYDDHFDLGADRVFEVSDADTTLRIELDDHYAHAQVYLPHPDWPLPGDFVCIEPMVASTNALVTEAAATVAPGDRYAATFTVTVA